MALTQTELYHHELTDWKKSISFYKDEFRVLNARLAEVVTKNTEPQLMAQSEHFQNQFIVQREQLDILAHDVTEQTKFMEDSYSQFTKKMAPPVLEKQKTLRDRIQTAEKLFMELKHEFYGFLSRIL